MTRSDVMASSRPRTAGAGVRSFPRRILAIVALLALATALLAPAAALAGETSGYNQEPNKPKTGTSPSKETKAETPKAETEPTTATAPATEKASTLPYTGFDLRWDVAIGAVLMAAGASIVVVQRRQRRNSGR